MNARQWQQSGVTVAMAYSGTLAGVIAADGEDIGEGNGVQTDENTDRETVR